MPRSKRAGNPIPSTEPTNGRAKPKRARKPRKPAVAEPDQVVVGQPPPAAPPPAPPPAAPPAAAAAPAAPPPAHPSPAGRLLVNVPRSEPTWFHEPWIPGRCLVLVVGKPNAGKSTFGAWCCARATRPAILPGNEEDVGSALANRLLANGVDPGRCLLLDHRPWMLPLDEAALVAALRAHAADLLWIDPIDSYVGEINENDGPTVRATLESFSKVARAADCTVLAARHPGKDPTNVCPGSRQWLAVPREVVELRHDKGPPLRRALRACKDPFGCTALPRAFTLEGEPKRPKRFVLGGELSEQLVDTLGIGDQVEQLKIDQAVELLKGLLADGELPCRTCYGEGEQERLSERTVRYAAQRLGLERRSERQGRTQHFFWSLPKPSAGQPAG